MKNRTLLSRLMAFALTLALIVLSPGLPAYQAAAGEFAAPAAAGLPAGGAWGPYVQNLAVSVRAGAVDGVDLAPVLDDLRGVDLRSAEGRAQVQPLFDALAQLP